VASVARPHVRRSVVSALAVHGHPVTCPGQVRGTRNADRSAGRDWARRLDWRTGMTKRGELPVGNVWCLREQPNGAC
jgi:hypothetical protein